jgi:pilus assembly protein CpaF
MLKKKKNVLGLFRKNRRQEEKPSKPVEVRHEQGESQINRAVEFTASGRAHSLFFAPESEGKDFSSVLADVQAYISANYSTLITGNAEDARTQMKRYITKYIQDRRIAVNGMSGEMLVDALYTEMAEYGFLTKYIFGTGVEEIDVNSWRDIEVQYSDGRTVKLDERFDSPEHALSVIRRMLHVSGMVLDNASPVVLGHLSKNIRIAVLKSPIVDEDVGVAASIRIVNPQSMQKEDFIENGTATGPMLDFLSLCVRYGISVCVAGATSSGKTTVAGWILTTVPDNKRIYTIENGSRELALVREQDGRVVNRLFSRDATATMIGNA